MSKPLEEFHRAIALAAGTLLLEVSSLILTRCADKSNYRTDSQKLSRGHNCGEKPGDQAGSSKVVSQVVVGRPDWRFALSLRSAKPQRTPQPLMFVICCATLHLHSRCSLCRLILPGPWVVCVGQVAMSLRITVHITDCHQMGGGMSTKKPSCNPSGPTAIPPYRAIGHHYALLHFIFQVQQGIALAAFQTQNRIVLATQLPNSHPCPRW